MPSRLRSLCLLCSTAALLTTGCDNLFGLGSETSLLQVMVTHHATPEDGAFPTKRTALGDSVFDNDEGWHVTLTAAFVVTADVTLETCEGAELPLPRYWGPLPEDLNAEDLGLFAFAGTELSPGDYCGVTVTYGPFHPSAEDRQRVGKPEGADKLEGQTIYLEGFATRGTESIAFEIESDEELVLHRPIVTDSGGPLRVSGKEPFPVDLTLSKTYDRLFDGIDFGSASQDDLKANALATLELETRLNHGAEVDPS